MPNYVERDGQLYRRVVGSNGQVRETLITDSVHMNSEEAYAFRQFQINQETGRNDPLVPQQRKKPDWEAVRRAFS